jgi:hypothetical protein
MLMNSHDDESDMKSDAAEYFEFSRDISDSDSRELRLVEIGLELPRSFAIFDSDTALDSLDLGSSTYI